MIVERRSISPAITLEVGTLYMSTDEGIKKSYSLPGPHFVHTDGILRKKTNDRIVLVLEFTTPIRYQHQKCSFFENGSILPSSLCIANWNLLHFTPERKVLLAHAGAASPKLVGVYR